MNCLYQFKFQLDVSCLLLPVTPAPSQIQLAITDSTAACNCLYILAQSSWSRSIEFCNPSVANSPGSSVAKSPGSGWKFEAYSKRGIHVVRFQDMLLAHSPFFRINTISDMHIQQNLISVAVPFLHIVQPDQLQLPNSMMGVLVQ